jgi:hypothetical protein
MNLFVFFVLLKGKTLVIHRAAKRGAVVVADIEVPAYLDGLCEGCEEFGRFFSLDTSSVLAEILLCQWEVASDTFAVAIEHGKHQTFHAADILREGCAAGSSALCLLDGGGAGIAANETELRENAISRFLKVAWCIAVVEPYGIAVCRYRWDSLAPRSVRVDAKESLLNRLL